MREGRFDDSFSFFRNQRLSIIDLTKENYSRYIVNREKLWRL